MTITTPPRRPFTPPPGDPEALFAEARRYRRQRRLRLAAYLVAVLVLGAGAYAVVGHGATSVGATEGRAGGAPAPVKAVVLLVDVSGSMRADDVKPTRLDAAVRAMRSFVDRLPATVEVGLVSFSSTAKVVQAPTRDRARIRMALGTLEPEAGTALGDGLALATRLTASTLQREGIGRGSDGFLPAAIVLESDGAQNRGRTQPMQAGALAKAAGIRVYGVALGKPDGTVYFGFGLFVNSIPVPPDEPTVRSIAHRTGGAFFVARTAARLTAVYAQLASTLGG